MRQVYFKSLLIVSAACSPPVSNLEYKPKPVKSVVHYLKCNQRLEMFACSGGTVGVYCDLVTTEMEPDYVPRFHTRWREGFLASNINYQERRCSE